LLDPGDCFGREMLRPTGGGSIWYGGHSVGWLVPGMRCIFCLGWQGMLELVEIYLDILTRHGDGNMAVVIVSFDGETTVLKGAYPVGRDGA
jgi:hypothetical protein